MKKVTALLAAAALALSLPTSSMAQSEPSAWALNEVDVSATNFLKAVDGEIDYAKGITRRQFAVIALHVYGSLSGVEIPPMTIENPFTDCNDPLVVTAYGLGIVNGVSATEFSPDELVTREQICVMISRMASSISGGVDFSAFLPSLDEFADGDSVSDWAKDSVKLCVMGNIIKGTDEGKLDPQGNCTVEQALIIAKRIKNIGIN